MYTYNNCKLLKTGWKYDRGVETLCSITSHVNHVCHFLPLAPIIMSTYRPDSDRAMEIRLYDANTNPSPIIDLIEQEMAMRAEGEVHVYLEYERDLSSLKKVVKVTCSIFIHDVIIYKSLALPFKPYPFDVNPALSW